MGLLGQLSCAWLAGAMAAKAADKAAMAAIVLGAYM
jgi:hypothetical protein